MPKEPNPKTLHELAHESATAEEPAEVQADEAKEKVKRRKSGDLETRPAQ